MIVSRNCAEGGCRLWLIALLVAVAASAQAPLLPPVERVPDGLGNKKLAESGVLDVTQAPFYADPAGKKDSTHEIRRAIEFARDHRLVAFFPAGTYRVSDTIEAVRGLPSGPGRKVFGGGRMIPCVLIGDRRGKRTRILLSPHSPGFDDPGHTKPVIHMWAPGTENHAVSQPNVNFNQIFADIDIAIGEGNPGAVAIKHPAAQGSAIFNSTIDVTHGHTGIQGGIGSGGSQAGITIIGGRIGLDLRDSQPAPTVAGVTLIGQTEAAIIANTLQSLSAVGVKIVSSAPGPVVVGTSPPSTPQRGQMCFIDTQIIFEKEAGVGFSSVRSLYLNNVYAKNASKLVANPDGSELKGNPGGWMRIEEYAHGAQTPLFQKQYQFEAPVYVDGIRRGLERVEGVENGAVPPHNLQSRHLWDADYPTWQSTGAVNVRTAYGAKGDGQADDTLALQKAIDANEIVFLPKGFYRVSRTLRLRPKTKLVGVGQHLSVILAREAEGDFTDSEHPRPLVETADQRDAATVIDSCGLLAPKEVTGAYPLNWRAGRRSILRSVEFMETTLQPGGKPPVRNTPFVVVSGHGGGRWYNFFAEFSTAQGPGYRHLLVHGTSEPLTFYQCNAEHARSDANMEVRNAKHVTIYGFKGEGNFRLLWIRDSDDVRVYGYGGNAAAYERTSLFRVERTRNFVIANAVDQPRLPGKGSDDFWAGRGVDPREWHMIIEETADGEIRTRPLDRPVVYRRGQLR